MQRSEDLSGLIRGRLVVTERVEGHSNRWYALCSCGGYTQAQASDLKRGNVNSCGCFRREVSASKSRTHGESQERTREYRVWCGMRQRCFDPGCKDYARYGARGVSVCPSWDSYARFLKDMGRCPSGAALERSNNALGYSKANCVWATPLEQGNNKRSNHRAKLGEEVKTLAEWARDPRCKVSYSLLRARVSRRGWLLADALSFSDMRGKREPKRRASMAGVGK